MIKSILIAPDKFKGSLTSLEVCRAVEAGLRQHAEALTIISLPMADGGDGLLDILSHYTAATSHHATVTDPLGRPVEASWLLSADGRTAFVEMAQASGLHLLTPSEYDPLHASTFGTGQLIAEAIRSGAKEIVIGIGGSATNDGGMGMAAALGFRFLDRQGAALPPGGGSLGRVAKIIGPGRPRDAREPAGAPWPGIRFRVAVDVNNPLCGPQGATRVYAPQKGADADRLDSLEAGMQKYAAALNAFAGGDVAGREGAGAAGGLGAGCMAFLHAVPVRGIDLVFEYSGAARQIEQADLVITGEGKIDEQTLQGKVVAGVAELGRRYGKRVFAVCGQLALTRNELDRLGIERAVALSELAAGPEDSMRRAAEWVQVAAGMLAEEL
ncbi:MAG: glycerate kinase [Bacteroidota bacterium]|nr:glycerate kinase [Bacteroidota bacterium]MDP4245996.1 glycerate kinase [Bacteroidota bacterium]MDP4255137.1 glycerate kinase [Bacteroidota bacterium]MDP4260393.1 glycerate kinase [Bacteroidota bacterium]